MDAAEARHGAAAVDLIDARARRVIALGILSGVPLMLVLLITQGPDDVVTRVFYPPVVVLLLGYAWVLLRRPEHASTASRLSVLALDVAWIAAIGVRLWTADSAGEALVSLFPMSVMGVVVFLVLGFLDRSARVAVLHGAVLITAVVVTMVLGMARLPGGDEHLVDVLRYGVYLTVVLFLLQVLAGWKNRVVQAVAEARAASATAVEMRDMAYLDELTGIANRRRLVEELTFQAGLVSQDHPVAVIYFDLDHFKTVNDTRGHSAGDDALRVVARTAAREVRQGDLVARLGGEEFVVVTPGVGRDQAVQVAERLREILPSETDVAVGVPLTASFGVVELRRGERPEDVLVRVDGLMYEAKSSGRNTVQTTSCE
jgi:diguanylate cyclase